MHDWANYVMHKTGST